MPDSAYAAFIDDCVQERASLIGLIESIESKMLAPGIAIVISGINGRDARTLYEGGRSNGYFNRRL